MTMYTGFTFFLDTVYIWISVYSGNFWTNIYSIGITDTSETMTATNCQKDNYITCIWNMIDYFITEEEEEEEKFINHNRTSATA